MHTGFINGGFFVFDRRLFNYLTPDEDCDLEFGALQQLSNEKQLRAFKHMNFWQCMDNIRDRDYLNMLWNNGKAPWKLWK
ncbi:glucose-1-phosphate cytidylyltransferase [Candidatus Magnetoovum chiemensis]|nr:glucose-1-phosphate cytidylyltransferase [Candidatus Magnetoovum chiemensis]